MEAEKLNIIESNITDIDSIVEVCINSICYEPEINRRLALCRTN